jgi:hypothetical protein
MKVFISHSWKNKTRVQQIADELKAAGVELWLDAGHLLPGQPIQETIDAVLKEVNIMILVWSKEASESDGVAAEIYTASSLKKTIIPCHLDNTSTSTHPYLQQIKGIRFNDFADGIGRLKMTLFNYMARDFNLHGSDTVKAMNEFMGSLETANHLIHKEDIKNKGSEADKDYWINKIQGVEASAFDKMKEEERIGKENTEFMNQLFARLQSNLNNKNEVAKILAEMKAWKHADRPDMKMMTAQVEAIYRSFENTETDDAITKYRKEIEQKLAVSKDQLKHNFGALADFLFASAFENMRYFFLSSSDHLQKLLQLGRSQDAHPVITDCANELLQYIKTPGGVIDNNQYGILGYSDDAYFIHSIISALQQEGMINTQSWNIDWIRINAGSDVVFNIVGHHIKNQLDQNIYNYCQQLVQKYAPQQVQQPLSHQQQIDALQKAKDDVWKTKLMSLETAMIQNPVW